MKGKKNLICFTDTPKAEEFAVTGVLGKESKRKPTWKDTLKLPRAGPLSFILQ